MDDVINFINEFTSNGKNSEVIFVFKGKCSYWFSIILFRRFIRSNAEIVYSFESGHFGTRIQNKVYDINGEILELSDWFSWIEMNDSELKRKITLEQIMF